MSGGRDGMQDGAEEGMDTRAEAADDEDQEPAIRAFETFKESGAYESSGALFEVSLKFENGREEESSDSSSAEGERSANWIVRQLSKLRWI